MGSLKAKVDKALASVAAIRGSLGEQNIVAPAKLSDFARIVELVLCNQAVGWTTKFETDEDTLVNAYAFYRQELWKVIAPNVWKVGYKAFAECALLEYVDLSGADDLDESCLDGCTALRELTISEGIWGLWLNFNGHECLESVSGCGGIEFFGGSGGEHGAPFANCTSLVRTDFSNRLYEMTSYAFYNCYNLEEVGDMSGIGCFMAYTFYNCMNLKSAFDLDECAWIEDHAFDGCLELPFNNGAIHAPDLEGIGYLAFRGCRKLKKLYIYNCLEIDTNAFFGSYIQEIHFSTFQAYSIPGFSTRWGAGSDVEVYVDL